MRVYLASLLMFVAGVAVAQYPPDVKCLVSNGQGYAFGNPRQIAVGLASGINVSPDGRFVSMRTIAPMDPLDEVRGKATSPRYLMSIWDSRTDQTWKVAEATDAAPVMFDFTWSPGTGQGVLIQSRTVQVDKAEKLEVVIDRVSAPTKNRQTVSRHIVDYGNRAEASPYGRYVLVTGLDGGTRDEVVDVASGRRQTVPPLAENESRYWGGGGLVVFGRDATGLVRRVRDVSLPEVAPSGGPTELPADTIEPPFLTSILDFPGKEGTRVLAVMASDTDQRITAAAQAGLPPRVEGQKPAATPVAKMAVEDPSLRGPVVIDLDPSEQVVSPQGRFVAYAKRGGVYICPFEKVEEDWLRKLMAKRAQLRAMNKAKQVGTALMIYGADYDDLLPPNGNWQNIVDPYLKNRELTNGFNYIMDGQDLAKLESPSTTEIGSVDTPYGRAVVYGDGHVKWVPASSGPEAFLTLLAEERRRVGV